MLPTPVPKTKTPPQHHSGGSSLRPPDEQPPSQPLPSLMCRQVSGPNRYTLQPTQMKTDPTWWDPSPALVPQVDAAPAVRPHEAGVEGCASRSL